MHGFVWLLTLGGIMINFNRRVDISHRRILLVYIPSFMVLCSSFSIAIHFSGSYSTNKYVFLGIMSIHMLVGIAWFTYLVNTDIARSSDSDTGS